MNRELCQRYLEDPDAHPAHPATCAECRALFEELNTKVQNRPVRVEALPLAAWEGSTYRAWPLVAGGALTVVAMAAALFAAAGASPAVVLGSLLRDSIPSVDVLLSFVGLARGVVQSAPIFIVASFICVNAILIALLRRAPKGLDV